MYTNEQQVIEGIKERHARGDSLRYTPTQRDETPLYNACIKIFGNYRTAVNAAGFDYDKITGRRTWSAEKVITEIQRINAEGSPLNPRYVNKNHAALYRQACNYFGSWKAAIEKAIDVDYDDVMNVTKWTKELLLERIKQRVESGKSLTTISLIKDSEKCLLDAGSRYFGDWATAVEAAGYDYADVLNEGKESRSESCTKNTEDDIKNFIISRFKQGLPLNSGHIDREYQTYMKSARYRFGNWRKAVESCGIDYLSVSVDSDVARHAGHIFEQMVADVLTELGINYSKESQCKWRPDFVINKDYWIDAKLSTWTHSIPETIKKYEPHVKRLTIVYFRGEQGAPPYREITNKTDMIHINELIKNVGSPEKRKHFELRMKEINGVLTQKEAL